jgi:hypothetical protein
MFVQMRDHAVRAIPNGDRTNMKGDAIQPFHRDDLKRIKELAKNI